MTNILLMLDYTLSDNSEEYAEMTRLSSNSYKKNLAGDWSLDILRKDFSHLPRKEALNQMWQDCIWAMFDHWVDGTNVLYVDSDTLMVKPTEIFGRWDRLQLFWPTDPSAAYGFDPYLNGGVVYICQETFKKIFGGILRAILLLFETGTILKSCGIPCTMKVVAIIYPYIRN